jgi:hypothetical protein
MFPTATQKEIFHIPIQSIQEVLKRTKTLKKVTLFFPAEEGLTIRILKPFPLPLKGMNILSKFIL